MSMFENMVICVEILFSLNISVKYAQCVKIWLFLKCVQFPEVLCSVSSEAKGRCAYRTRVSHLSKGRRAYIMSVSHLSKGRRVLWRCVSLLLNIHKKRKLTNYSPRECSLHESTSANGHVRAWCKNHRVENNQSEIFEAHRLSWVKKLVSITSSRRGGTKLLNRVGASGKGDTC
jgi:hypothetical protein